MYVTFQFELLLEHEFESGEKNLRKIYRQDIRNVKRQTQLNKNQPEPSPDSKSKTVSKTYISFSSVETGFLSNILH